jgi:hypothetical protein
MKLTTFTTALRNNTVKLLAGAALAGAVLTAAPAAQAQRIVFGIGFGGPRFYRPAPPVIVYGGPGYYGYRHFDGWRDRDDFYRHHDWDRDRGFRDHDFRDHDRFDHR